MCGHTNAVRVSVIHSCASKNISVHMHNYGKSLLCNSDRKCQWIIHIRLILFHPNSFFLTCHTRLEMLGTPPTQKSLVVCFYTELYGSQFLCQSSTQNIHLSHNVHGKWSLSPHHNMSKLNTSCSTLHGCFLQYQSLHFATTHTIIWFFTFFFFYPYQIKSLGEKIWKKSVNHTLAIKENSHV